MEETETNINNMEAPFTMDYLQALESPIDAPTFNTINNENDVSNDFPLPNTPLFDPNIPNTTSYDTPSLDGSYGSPNTTYTTPESSTGTPSPTSTLAETIHASLTPPLQSDTGKLPFALQHPFSDEFLNAMAEVLLHLSTTPNFDSNLLRAHHPMHREELAIYLGSGGKTSMYLIPRRMRAGWKKITKLRGSKNTVHKGGTNFTHIIPNVTSYSLKYVGDSPPEGMKHLVVWVFSLEFAGVEKNTKKRKTDKTKPEGILRDLRIYLTLLSKDENKVKLHNPTEQQENWKQVGGTLFTNANVAVGGSIQASNFIYTTSQGVSDKTTKENIQPLGNALDSINKLPIYSYNYKGEYGNPNHTVVGPMAQDVEKVIPNAVTKMQVTGALDGKLAVNHNTVLYTSVKGLQDLTYLVKCLAICMAKIDAGESIKKIVRAIGNCLPPLPPSSSSPSPIEQLLKENIIRDEEGQDRKRINLDHTTTFLAKYLRGTRHVYERQLGGQKTSEQEEEEDKTEEEQDKDLLVARKLKRIEALLAEVQVKKAEVNQAWEIQCSDCGTLLCDLNQLHFFYTPDNDHIKYHLVSDVTVSEWKGTITVQNTDLKCYDCGLLFGHMSPHRGRGSPKPELEVRKVKFVNTKKEFKKEFKTANDAYQYFAEQLAVEARYISVEDQLEEAKEAEELKIAAFPPSKRVTVRPVAPPGAAKAKSVIMIIQRRDKIADLMDNVRKELPDTQFDGLFLSDDLIDMLDPNKYANELLHQDDILYCGLIPQNEMLIHLRKYQRELLARAVAKNSAVVCPTGSGKTAVAVEVERTLRGMKQGEFKTVMVVRDLPLSVQQYNYFMKNTRKVRVNLINSDRPLIQTWEEMLEMQDIVILTAQVLLNNLEQQRAHLNKIDLLILDEAHHTAKNHPFNKIMREHFHKLPENERPRVLALTASPPAHVSYERTKHLIQEFEDATACSVILVDEYKTELRKDISIPETTVYPIAPSQFEKLLLQLVTSAMKSIETKKKVPTEEEKERDITRGSPEYERNCLVEELKFLNSVLMSLNDDGDPELLLRTKEDEYDTVRKILAGLGAVHDRSKARTEIFLHTLESFKDIPDFRGIVFVATKQGGEHIKHIIQERGNSFSFIKPHTFFGHQDKKTGLGLAMSSSLQQKVIEQFKKGEVNLLIATSVAEEGLDLTACNVVFRYDSVFSHRSLIQTRGRARQKNSKFIIFYLEKSPAEEAWKASEKKLENMLLAVGEDLKDTPFLSLTTYRNTSGDSIIPQNAFPDSKEATPPVTNSNEPTAHKLVDESEKDKSKSDKEDEGDEEDSEEDEEDEEDSEEEDSDEDSVEGDDDSDSPSEEVLTRKQPAPDPISPSSPANPPPASAPSGSAAPSASTSTPPSSQLANPGPTAPINPTISPKPPKPLPPIPAIALNSATISAKPVPVLSPPTAASPTGAKPVTSASVPISPIPTVTTIAKPVPSSSASKSPTPIAAKLAPNPSVSKSPAAIPTPSPTPAVPTTPTTSTTSSTASPSTPSPSPPSPSPASPSASSPSTPATPNVHIRVPPMEMHELFQKVFLAQNRPTPQIVESPTQDLNGNWGASITIPGNNGESLEFQATGKNRKAAKYDLSAQVVARKAEFS